MRRIVHASLVAGLLAIALPAQARKPLLGTVVDGDGKPIAGAAVECVLAPDGPDLPPVDVLTATTDARGRFRVDALPCAEYECWAAGPADSAGDRWITAVERVAVGQVVALAARERVGAKLLPIEGLAAWQARAPFTLRTFVPGSTVDAPVEAVDGGFVVRRAVAPFGNAPVQLLDRDGQVVVADSLYTAWSRRLDVPSPQTVRCRVVDEAGKPVAGARIVRIGEARRTGFEANDRRTGLLAQRSSRSPASVLAVTDADGVAVAQIAAGVDLFGEASDPRGRSVQLRAETPGKSFAYAGRVFERLFENRNEVAKGGGRDGWTFVLTPAEPVTGRLVDGGKPLRSVPVVLEFQMTIASKDNWSTMWSDAITMTTDDDGRFRCDGVPAHATLQRVSFRVTNAQLAASDGAPHALHPVFQRPLGERGDAKRELIVDLAALCAVTLSVRDDGGAPDRATQVAVVAAQTARSEFDRIEPFAPDASGRVVVLVERGDWLAVACTRDGIAVQPFDAEAPTAAVELAIEPFSTMRARLVDADGKPVVGASFRVSGQGASGIDGDLPAKLRQWMAQSGNGALLGRAKSGADGIVRAPMIVAPLSTTRGQFQLDARRSAAIQAAPEDLGDVVVK